MAITKFVNTARIQSFKKNNNLLWLTLLSKEERMIFAQFLFYKGFPIFLLTFSVFIYIIKSVPSNCVPVAQQDRATVS